MSYTRRDLGKDLNVKLTSGASISEIARWAHQVYLGVVDMDSDVIDELMTLVAMVEGPEFELSLQELYEYADRLMD